MSSSFTMPSHTPAPPTPWVQSDQVRVSVCLAAVVSASERLKLFPDLNRCHFAGRQTINRQTVLYQAPPSATPRLQTILLHISGHSTLLN